MPSPTTYSLYAVTMVGDDDGWIVGDWGTVLRWNGSSWFWQSAPTANGFYAVDALRDGIV